MLFNTIDFAIFLPIVFAVYWIFKSNNARNVVVVVASYIFYGWWDARFLALIALSTIIDFFIGKSMALTSVPARRRFLLIISICTNLGILGFFKYWNFFIDNFKTAYSFFGMEPNFGYMDIVLPVGISFYTFQTMSYSIDVYRKKMEASNNLIDFAAFVSFFPQLVAGPIERAGNLLPQFAKNRHFSYPDAVLGMRQILWGLFKKMVIADNCAVFVNMIFDTPESYTGSTLLLGAIFFAFQIYGDFSGYSDIAIGTARLFGINLMQNFAFPYFSRDVAEFWRRWHISLSTWFRDYIYIPLGGSRGSKMLAIRNIFIIFVVSGFWHGANWTFIVWGAIHAAMFIPLFVFNRNRRNLIPVQTRMLFPSIGDALSILQTFALVTLAWVFFRANSLGDALHYLRLMLNSSIVAMPDVHNISRALLICACIGLMLIIEWVGRLHSFALAEMKWFPLRWLRWTAYVLIVVAIGLLMPSEQVSFIYFQF